MHVAQGKHGASRGCRGWSGSGRIIIFCSVNRKCCCELTAAKAEPASGDNGLSCALLDSGSGFCTTRGRRAPRPTQFFRGDWDDRTRGLCGYGLVTLVQVHCQIAFPLSCSAASRLWRAASKSVECATGLWNRRKRDDGTPHRRSRCQHVRIYSPLVAGTR